MCVFTHTLTVLEENTVGSIFNDSKRFTQVAWTYYFSKLEHIIISYTDRKELERNGPLKVYYVMFLQDIGCFRF